MNIMKPDNDWKQRLGVVYSTDPNFNYATEETAEAEAPAEEAAEEEKKAE